MEEEEEEAFISDRGEMRGICGECVAVGTCEVLGGEKGEPNGREMGFPQLQLGG